MIAANPAFSRLLVAQACSALGDRMFPVIATLILLNHGASAATIGLALALRVLAIVIVALWGGVIAERWPRRVVLVATSLIQLGTVCSLLFTRSSVWIAVPFAIFVVGGAEGLFRPACRAAVPKVLAQENLTSANAAIAVAQRIAGFLSPMMGAAVFTFASQAAVLLCAAFFAIAATVAMRSGGELGGGSGRSASVLSMLSAGFSYTASRQWIMAILCLSGVQLTLAVAPTTVLLPIVSKAYYGEYLYGIALSALAAGALVGAAVPGRVRTDLKGTVSMVGLALYALPLMALAFRQPAVLVVSGFFIAGVGVEPFAIWWYAALQSTVPESMLGRVLSIDWILSFALQPAGMALAGPFAERFGTRVTLLASAGVVLVTSVSALAVPGVPRFRDRSNRRTALSDEGNSVSEEESTVSSDGHAASGG